MDLLAWTGRDHASMTLTSSRNIDDTHSGTSPPSIRLQHLLTNHTPQILDRSNATAPEHDRIGPNTTLGLTHTGGIPTEYDPAAMVAHTGLAFEDQALWLALENYSPTMDVE